MASQAIGIDIGKHAVKIAVLQKKGAVTRAVRLYRAPLGGDEDMVRIQGALKRGGITGGPALLGITGRDLIVRYTHVPPVPDWRLKLLMQFEINEVSGQSGGEVAADYRRLDLPIDSDDDTVLVALARNTWLHPRLEAARGAGMKADGGCPNSVALFNAYLAHGTWNDGESVFLVNIGRDNIDMSIQRDGELVFARNMAGGGQMFTEAIMGTFGLKEGKAEKNKTTKGDLTPKGQARYPDSTTEKIANAMQGPAGQLVSMIQSSVMICRAQTKVSDLTIDRLVLSGGTARMKGIRDYFEANMNVPVEIFDPVGELDASGLDEDDAGELGDTPTDFAIAVGLAETLLQPTSFKLEVLTESEKKKRHFMQRTVWALAAGVAALVLVVMLFRTHASDIEAVRAANDRLQSAMANNQKVENRLKEALEGEKDARQKELALRVRRLTAAFGRALLDVLLENHLEGGHLYLRTMTLESNRVSLDLDGRPGETRSTMGASSEKQDSLHDQHVWPEATVRGVVKRDAPQPGAQLNAYYSQLRGAVAQLRIDGFPVEMDESQLDASNQFSITFRLKAPEAEKVGE